MTYTADQYRIPPPEIEVHQTMSTHGTDHIHTVPACAEYPMPGALPLADVRKRLDGLLKDVHAATRQQIGYPVNQDFDYSDLLPFLDYSINNVGDPFHPSNFWGNTHEIEREVIGIFAGLMRLERGDAWGYVTSGGTEGNMYGLYLARELFPNAMFYFSEETHYSVLKNVRVLNARHIMVRRQDSGEIDYDDLEAMIRVNRDVPAVIMANVGTTMRGAVDDISRIRGILRAQAVTSHYIHADAALSGMILPFVSDPQPYGFDAGVDSISVSGHKLIGAPLPCGVVLTKRPYVERVGRAIEYVGVEDTTLSGSRNALAPLMIWYAFARYGHEGFRRMVSQMLDTAEYAVGQFNERGIPAWRHRNSVTVVFPRPKDDVFRKWQMAPEGEIAHIITMPHVTHDMIDELVDDCAGSP
ncbi:MAG: histidine decarboxylase [Chloroflexi bacterium]|nr:histidine decarboxylase [Chloroflexota bacterium]